MVPSYVIDDRLPRNTAGTLLHAAEMCADDDFIVLCDPDLLFVRKVTFSCICRRKLLLLPAIPPALSRERRSKAWVYNVRFVPQRPTIMLRRALRHPDAGCPPPG